MEILYHCIIVQEFAVAIENSGISDTHEEFASWGGLIFYNFLSFFRWALFLLAFSGWLFFFLIFFFSPGGLVQMKTGDSISAKHHTESTLGLKKVTFCISSVNFAII